MQNTSQWKQNVTLQGSTKKYNYESNINLNGKTVTQDPVVIFEKFQESQKT